MWSRGTFGLLALVVLVGAVGTLAAVGTASGSSPPGIGPTSELAGSCDANYHPVNVTIVADCSVPGSEYCIDLSSVGLGNHCFNSIDLNPVDWGGYFVCLVIAQAQAIWNAIVGFVGTFLVQVFQDVLTALEVPIQAVLNVLQGAFIGGVQWFGNLLTSFFATVNAAAAPLGPFAPILVVAMTLVIFLAGIIGLYFVATLLLAIFRTGFNLL